MENTLVSQEIMEAINQTFELPPVSPNIKICILSKQEIEAEIVKLLITSDE